MHFGLKGNRDIFIIYWAISICLFFGLVHFGLTVNAAEKTTFSLTKEEEESLKSIQNKTIVIGVSEEMEYSVDEEGNETGIIVPLKEFLEYEADLTIKVQKEPSSELLKKAEEGEIDLLFLPDDKAGGENFELSLSFFESPVICLAKSPNVKWEAGKKVGIVSSSREEAYVKACIPSECEIKTYKDSKTLLYSLSSGETEAVFMGEESMGEAYQTDGIWLGEVYGQMKIPYALGTKDQELKPIFAIWERFIGTTEEGEESILRMEEEREAYQIRIFAEKEADSLKVLQKSPGKLSYFPGMGNNIPLYYREGGDEKGILPDMVQYAEKVTGMYFSSLTFHSEKEAASAMKKGKIDFMLTESGNGGKEKLFSNPFYQEWLVSAGTSEAEVEGTTGYWGTLESNLPLLDGNGSISTYLSKNIIPYSSFSAMAEDLENGSLGTVLISQGELAYLNLVEGKKYFQKEEGALVKIPISGYFACLPEKTDLKKILDEVIRFYQLSHPGQLEGTNTVISFYNNQAAVKTGGKTGMLPRFLALAVVFIFFAGFSVIAIQRMKWMKLKVKTLVRSNEKQALIEVDLRKKLICSSTGFSVYGISPGKGKKQGQKKKQSFTELSHRTGFDFTAHYEKIVEELKKKDRNSFEVEFSIEGASSVYYIRETGCLEGWRLVSTVFDISIDKKENSLLRMRADYDDLTGLYNRNAYEKKICEIVEQYPEKLGVFAFIDMNKFKQINDTYGHAVGDDILFSFALSIQRLVKDDTTVAFRIGGDEFGIFRGNIEDEQELRMFCKELQQLCMYTEVKGEKVTTTYSTGVSVFNRDAVSLQKLIECADEAMYYCKQNGLKIALYEICKIKQNIQINQKI